VAERIEAPTVTVPAGTPISAPQTTNLSWLDGRLVRVEIVIPPGPSGFVGFQIGHSNQVIIPRNTSQFIVDDGKTLDWEIDNYPTGAKWFVRVYNTGLYVHTLYFRMHINELTPIATSIPIPLPIVAVGPSVDVGA
jgi:hypothetical protein